MNSMIDIGTIIAKSIAVYVFVLLAIRLFGKKELAQLSVIDLVFILLISNSVQNAMVGSDTSLIGGLAAAASLFIINYIFKLLLVRFPTFSKVVQGEPVTLIYNGKVLKDNLDKTMFSLSELEANVREHGVKGIEEVDLAVLEVDGNISIISHDFKNKSVRKRKSHKVISKALSDPREDYRSSTFG